MPLSFLVEHFMKIRGLFLLLIALWTASIAVATAKAASVSSPTSHSVPTRWIGTLGGTETIELRLKKGHVVANYRIDEADPGGPIPEKTTIMCRLPQGVFSGSFLQKSWHTGVLVKLKRTSANFNSGLLPEGEKGEIGCTVERYWRGRGSNVSSLRLLPLGTRVFRSRKSYSGQAMFSYPSFAPKVTIRGATAWVDARPYADGIDTPKDIAILCNLPNGQACGLVRGARWAKSVVKIPLRVFSTRKTSKPFCIVSTNGNFDFAPDSMASSPAFKVPLSSTR